MMLVVTVLAISVLGLRHPSLGRGGGPNLAGSKFRTRPITGRGPARRTSFSANAYLDTLTRTEVTSDSLNVDVSTPLPDVEVLAPLAEDEVSAWALDFDVSPVTEVPSASLNVDVTAPLTKGEVLEWAPDVDVSPVTEVAVSAPMVELLTPLWEIAVSAPLTEVPRGSLDFDVSALPATNPSAADADTKPFEWTKQWYPIAAVEYLDDEKPHAIKLLGMDLVIWNDGAVEGATKTTRKKTRGDKKRIGGTWRAFEDACPHRMAPLSEGRVEETGELLCAYHGWRYDGTGACTEIPTSPSDLREAHLSNPRAQCNAFPTTIADGLLWVWPESGENAALEAATLRSPSLIPELHDPKLKGRVKQLPWNVRELPYGWDMFMENVQDPAHVPVSHHGIVGDRYTSPRPIQIDFTEPVRSQSGYAFTIKQPSSESNALGAQYSANTFRPPSLLQIDSFYAGGAQTILALYASPSRPGYCTHIGCQVLLSDESKKLPKGVGLFALPMPTWLLHVTSSLFLNMDAVFLHHQEKILAQGALGRAAYTAQPEGGSYVQSVYTPNQADKGIITFRGWLAKHAQGGPPWTGSPALPPPSRDGKALFDVYESHTKNCKYCLDALKNIRRLKIGAFVVAALLILVRGALGAVPSALLAAGAALVGTALGKLQNMFYTYEFSHSSNN
mmetsp:Transcript_37127/g.85918  ORF Transcript_37127/g.85918 Transcript_37127/m.85918 type:complete len:673 (+) Transcript_37127:88-2106(+)